MSKTARTLADMKDSQLLYDKNPPPMGYILLFTVIAALAIGVVWSTAAKKPYVVKSAGIVASEEKNYIMSAYTGAVTEALVKEGDYVQKGDVLFRIASVDLDLQAEQLAGMIAVDEEKIAQYERLESCIKNGRNTFDENNEADKPYYYQYETYMSKIAQKEIDVSTYKSYGYSEGQIENAVVGNEAGIGEIYYSTLNSITEAVQNLQKEVDGYRIQLASVNNGQKEYPIEASASGIVHMDTEYKEGMVVQAASAIGTIITENGGYTAVVYTPANDMPLIHVGDEAKVAVSGLTQSIYGTVSGTVTYIASEPTVNQENGSSAFLTKIELDALYLVSNQGSKVNLSNGMGVEARIQYDEVSYFNYVLESLGVLTR